MKAGAFSWCAQLDASSHVFFSLPEKHWEPPGLCQGGLNPAAMPQPWGCLCQEEKGACEAGGLRTAWPGQEAPRPPASLGPAVDKEGSLRESHGGFNAGSALG